MMSRYKPVGWRKESHRHYLAAKGIKTRYDANKGVSAHWARYKKDPEYRKQISEKMSAAQALRRKTAIIVAETKKHEAPVEQKVEEQKLVREEIRQPKEMPLGFVEAHTNKLWRYWNDYGSKAEADANKVVLAQEGKDVQVKFLAGRFVVYESTGDVSDRSPSEKIEYFASKNVTKVFDTSTLQGLKAAEKYKERLENEGAEVRTEMVGIHKVSISDVSESDELLTARFRKDQTPLTRYGAKKVYEVTFVDPSLPTYGKSIRMTKSQAEKHFGKREWPEYRDGYLPHVVVAEVDAE